jgi:ABC-2 type transport system permease protein
VLHEEQADRRAAAGGFLDRAVVDPLSLYVRYLGVSIRSQMQYRASFVLSVFGQFFLTGIEFLGLWALFDRFGSLESWSLPEVALFYGVVNVSFAIADGLSTGFDQFSTYVKTGTFDRLLVRPRSTVLQLAGVELALRRIGRLAQGLLILVWASLSLDVAWSPATIGLLVASVLGGACLFFGLFVLQATICFFTTESLELMNTMTYGGVETAQYPLVIYAPWFRKFFTFVVPLAGVCYFPMLPILGRVDALGSPLWFQWASPATGLLFLLLSFQVWRLGVRRYTSTGS